VVLRNPAISFCEFSDIIRGRRPRRAPAIRRSVPAFKGQIMRYLLSALAAMVLLAGLQTAPALAHDYSLGALKLDHPWARASAGPVRTGAAFLVIHNSGPADRLLAVAGGIAERVEIHTHMMEGDVMKMRRVEAVAVPAGGTANLAPGSFHIMLIGLHAPLKEGDRFPLTLTFEKAGEVTVEVAVEGVGSMGPGGSAEGGMDHGTMNHDAMGHGGSSQSN
jgi:copper(I)-binding protein